MENDAQKYYSFFYETIINHVVTGIAPLWGNWVRRIHFWHYFSDPM